MPVKRASEAPVLPSALRRPLLALWLSLGLHGAVIALVQPAPPASAPHSLVIEARLETRQPVASSAPAMAPAEPLPPAETPKVQPRVPPIEPEPAPATTPEPPPPSVKPAEAERVPAPVEAAAPPPVAVPTPPPSAAAPAVRAAAAEREAPRPLLEMPTAVDLAYYSAREVDVLPRALREIRPDYPAEADRRRVSGSVRLQLKLEADGRVSDVAVVDANPPGMFEESALAAFREARFSPAQRNGRPVRARILIEVKYDYEGRLR